MDYVGRCWKAKRLGTQASETLLGPQLSRNRNNSIPLMIEHAATGSLPRAP